MKFGEHIHGWVNKAQIDEVMVEHGYSFLAYGERHDMTDGEVDFIYVKDGDEYRIWGNRWSYKTFKFPWNQPDEAV